MYVNNIIYHYPFIAKPVQTYVTLLIYLTFLVVQFVQNISFIHSVHQKKRRQNVNKLNITQIHFSPTHSGNLENP